MRFGFLALAFVPLFSIAQPKTQRASVAWAPDLDERETGGFGRIIGQSEDDIYMTMHKKKDLLVQQVDGSLKSNYSRPLSLELGKKDLGLEHLVVMGKHIVAFANNFDKKADMKTLYVRLFDKASMSPQGDWRSIAQFPAEKAREGSFDVSIAPNDKHVLVSVQLPNEKDSPERFRLMVFDGELEPEWEREVTLPYREDEFVVYSTRPDAHGDVLLMGKKFAERTERKELKRAGQAQYEHHIITFGRSAGSDQDYPLRVKDRFLKQLMLTLGDGDQDILCGGFYGNKDDNRIRGAFFLSLDPRTKAIKHESYKPFTDDFITQYMTAREEEKAKKRAERKDEELQLYEYDLDEIVRRDDGGAVLVGEQYYMYTTTNCYTTQGGGQTCTTTYHYIYNDIIVISIDPNGEISWASTIPKRQHSVNDGGYFSSYGMAVKGDKLYFVYNDNGENLFLNAGDKFKRTDFQGKNSIVTLATVSVDGHVTREALFDPEKRDLILRPKSCRQLEDDRLFIYATRKKNYKFGMVTFE